MKMVLTGFLFVCLLMTGVCNAATASFYGVSINKTFVADGGRWGGCMALTDADFVSAGLDCPAGWVSFSCTGDFVSKDVAYKMFDTAQMAMVLDRSAHVFVDDARKHNGYCFASRLDVW